MSPWSWPRWPRVVVGLAAVAGLVCTARPAVDGRFDSGIWRDLFPGLVVFAVLLVQVQIRRRGYRRLSAADRQLVRDSFRTGRPTGSAAADGVARAQLADATWMTPGNRLVDSVFAVLLLAVPVAAAIRVDPRLLFALIAMAPMSLELLSSWRRESPRARLERFDALSRPGQAGPTAEIS